MSAGRRRSRLLPAPNRSLAASLVAVVLLTVACDTGDGKQLKPYDPADYPATTLVAPGSSVIDGAGSDTLVPAESGVVAVAPAGSFTLIGPWAQGAPIDPRYTCDGEGIAPALSWSGVPSGTSEIAIVMVDDDAVSEGQPFVHWVIAGLNPAEIALVEGDTPAGAVQALNFFGDVAYGAPCPPPGDAPHRYRLTAYALNQPLGLADGSPATEFLDAIAPATIGSTDLVGTASR